MAVVKGCEGVEWTWCGNGSGGVVEEVTGYVGVEGGRNDVEEGRVHAGNDGKVS